jgi:hypothetical protein
MADQLTINLWGLQAQATGLVAVSALTALLVFWILVRTLRQRGPHL